MPMTSTENTNDKDLVILLKDLANINKDRTEGYRMAGAQAEADQNLSAIFYEKLKQSEDFVDELEEEIGLLEGNNNSHTSFAGRIFRVWMSIKNTLKPNDNSSILDSCNFGEEAAIRAYDEALHSDVSIPASIRHKILEQQTAIKKSQDLIRKYGALNLRPIRYNNSFT